MVGDKEFPNDLPKAAAEGSAGDEGFLRRWSRRKGSQVKAPLTQKAPGVEEAVASLADPTADGLMEQSTEVPVEAPVRGRMITSAPGESSKPAEPDEDADVDEAALPEIEELEADSDFTPFLKKGVSEQLQRRALRKLWLSDPVLANVDGLLDYGDDFTDAAMVVENLKTVYTVGRGMVPEPAEEEEVTEDPAEAEIQELAADQTETPEEGDMAPGSGKETDKVDDTEHDVTQLESNEEESLEEGARSDLEPLASPKT
ncbi:DUF3306 domain-containing protein [Pelagibius sp. Alg239-R121]|uniref:DUF3306 domain-containing protein n=1 Tax=Pelagibius sp. Alg239-R121 TaxID=2993448 RepID=UPI0024A7246F|nr:DUF3306 domain-containing protein [Pelagibius sp. Alg239-R121]